MVQTLEKIPVTQEPRPKPAKASWLPSGWAVLGVFIACVVIIPIATVFWMALFPAENIWPHLMSTTLPRYLKNSVTMMFGVGVLSALFGTLTAWLVVMYRFPGRRILQWALLLPLALPAYISAFAVVDFLEFAGPFQTWLRGLFGWQRPGDYMFPEVRSTGMAIVILSAALYPYVYFLTRTVFQSQSGSAIEVARALGCGPVSSFLRVGMPLARPAIAASVAIVMMETLNEFGAMEFFAVQTLTTGIFSVWLEASNAGGAAQIACVILVFVMVLVVLEKTSRQRIRFHETGRNMRPPEPQSLTGGQGICASLFCGFPVLIGFILPMLILLDHALGKSALWADVDLWRAAGRTVLVASLAASVTLAFGLLLVFSVRLINHPTARKLLPVTTIGYAAPGAVLGLGILYPLSIMDHRVADAILWLTGYDPGLLLVGSLGAIVLACSIRFFALAVGAIDAAFTKISPNLGMAARSLGRSPGQVLRELYTPLLRGAIGTALLLIFVDSAKELPATLLLYSKDTLATSVYGLASLEDIEGAAPGAIMIVLISLCAVTVLNFANRLKN